MKEFVSQDMKRYNYLLGELDATYHEASLKLGLSDSAMKILYAICDYGEGCMLQDICTSTGLSKQTINSSLRKLEAESILYLESVNAKSKKVILSEKGKELTQKTALRLHQMENEIFSSWNREEVKTYLDLTERFLVDLKNKINEL